MNTSNDIWVFAYGSLMWAPGFDYLEKTPAKLEGFHRDLCILSYVFRGTPNVPGLVMGLNIGGTCQGLAFRIEGAKVQNTLTYLHEREMINNVYAPSWVDIEHSNKEKSKAYTFLSIPEHPQYLEDLNIEETVKYVLQGQGKNGTALQYLENTLLHLRTLGIKSPRLETILSAAQAPYSS